MQRYGPPPSYPNLKIPGVNTPIMDPTAEVTPNLWTAPREELKGEPLFPTKKQYDTVHWGNLREEDEEISEAGEDMSIDDLDDELGLKDTGMTGMETPEINVAKNMLESNTYMLADAGMLDKASSLIPNPNHSFTTNVTDKNLGYKIIEQVPVNVKKSDLFGSSHAYIF